LTAFGSSTIKKARALIWYLGQMRGMLETQHLERIEGKLNELQASAEIRGLIT
jgi:hypothetical protein